MESIPILAIVKKNSAHRIFTVSWKYIFLSTWKLQNKQRMSLPWLVLWNYSKQIKFANDFTKPHW